MTRDNWVRVVTYTKTTDDPEAFDRYLDSKFQSLVTIFGNTPGHRRGYWVEDAAAGKIAVITHWMRREAIDEAGTVLGELRHEGESFGLQMLAENNFMIKKALIAGQNPWGTETAVRIVMYENTSDDRDAFGRYLEGPEFKNVERIFGDLAGYGRGYWGQDPGSGQPAVITYWSNPDVIAQAGASLAGLRAEGEATYGIKMVSENNYLLKRACDLE